MVVMKVEQKAVLLADKLAVQKVVKMVVYLVE
jgi:hypothetical protein